MLRTTRESHGESQPAVFEGRYWIAADARLDGRAELLAALDLSESEIGRSIPDSELILRGYAKWGSACVEHLRGDFSFAIWDAPDKRLFCARDQFGIKPFYYASVGSVLVFSNTLDCVRRHPAVSGRLNDLAIADFLLFDMIQEPGATSFADIQRLLPAHTLVCRKDDISLRRYWELPVTGPIGQKRPRGVRRAIPGTTRSGSRRQDKNEQRGRFDERWTRLSDRGGQRAADASAQRVPSGLRAYTEVFDSLIPHEERHYAGLVAEALKIPIEFQAEEMGLSKDRNHDDNRWPEPCAFTRVGWGSGTIASDLAASQPGGLDRLWGRSCAFLPALSSFLALTQGAAVWPLLAEAVRYLDSRRSVFAAVPSHALAKMVCLQESDIPLSGMAEPRPGKTPWSARALGSVTRATAPNAAVRPTAYEAMVDPVWPSLFEGCDSGVTRVPVEVCHPFFDLRSGEFLAELCPRYLGVPTRSCCARPPAVSCLKRSVYDASRPSLRTPSLLFFSARSRHGLIPLKAVPELGRYVERGLIPKVFGENRCVESLDSSAAAQFEHLVAVEGIIGYKNEGISVVKSDTHSSAKKLYQKPTLRVYGDIGTLTQSVASTNMHRDGGMILAMDAISRPAEDPFPRNLCSYRTWFMGCDLWPTWLFPAYPFD